MQIADFLSGHWWLTFGLGAIAWSLFNDAVKRLTYRSFGRFSAYWRKRNDAVAHAFYEDVDNALESPEHYSRWLAKESRYRQTAILRLLVAVFAIAVTPLIYQLPLDFLDTVARSLPPEPALVRGRVAPLLDFLIAMSIASAALNAWASAQRCRDVLRIADESRAHVAAEIQGGMPEGEAS